MKIRFILLCLIALSFCCPSSRAQKTNSNKNCSLQTGWYYISDSGEGIERKMYRTFESYFLDPTPIVTYEDFEQIKLDTTDVPRIILHLKADKIPVWAKATRESIGKKLGFIAGNVLISAPTVQSEIQSGVSQIAQPYSVEELKLFKRKMRNYEVSIPQILSQNEKEAHVGISYYAAMFFIDLTNDEGKEILGKLQKATQTNTPLRVFLGETRQEKCTEKEGCVSSKTYITKVLPASPEEISEYKDNKARGIPN